MKTKTNPHYKKITRLLARHLRLGDKGRDLFDRSGQALDEALALAVPVGEPIKLRDGRTVVVADQFAARNHAFAAKLFTRFRVTELKEPKKPGESKRGPASTTELAVAQSPAASEQPATATAA